MLSNTDQLHFYYVVQEPTQGSSTAAANIPGFGDPRDGFRQLMTIGEDHIFSPSLTDTGRIGFNRIHLLFAPTALDPAAFSIGLPSESPVGVAVPNINVSGDMDFGGLTNEPQERGHTTGVQSSELWQPITHSRKLNSRSNPEHALSGWGLRLFVPDSTGAKADVLAGLATSPLSARASSAPSL